MLIADHQADDNGVGVWDAIDSGKKGVANPRVGIWLDADEADEEWEHPNVASGRD